MRMQPQTGHPPSAQEQEELRYGLAHYLKAAGTSRFLFRDVESAMQPSLSQERLEEIVRGDGGPVDSREAWEIRILLKEMEITGGEIEAKPPPKPVSLAAGGKIKQPPIPVDLLNQTRERLNAHCKAKDLSVAALAMAIFPNKIQTDTLRKNLSRFLKGAERREAGFMEACIAFAASLPDPPDSIEELRLILDRMFPLQKGEAPFLSKETFFVTSHGNIVQSLMRKGESDTAHERVVKFDDSQLHYYSGPVSGRFALLENNKTGLRRLFIIDECDVASFCGEVVVVHSGITKIQIKASTHRPDNLSPTTLEEFYNYAK